MSRLGGLSAAAQLQVSVGWPAALSAVGDVTDPYIYGIHTPWRGILYHSAASPDLLKPTQGSVRMEFSRTPLS